MKIFKKVISMLTALAMSVSAAGVLAAEIVTSDSTDKQDVIIMDNETVLVKDVDYTLEYKDNVNVGEATVIIHFIGNYSGEKEQTFNIKRKPSTGGGGGGSSYRKPTSTATPIPTSEPTQTPIPAQTAEPNKFEHNSYIRGYEDGTFKPDGNITRAETAAILARLTDGFDENERHTSVFPDVDGALWYSKYISFEEQQDIIKGYEDGTFKPENNITRAEFASMITRFAKLRTADTEMPFADANKHWAREQVAACYDAGYINGYEDGTFRPDSPITRAETVKIINRVLDRIDFTNDVNPFRDVSDTHWAYKQILEAAVSHNVELK